MSRLARITALALVLFTVASSAFAQEPGPKSSFPAYLFTLFLGFGTGHYYLGANGTPFLLGDVAGVGLATAGLVIAGVNAAGGAYAVDGVMTDGFRGALIGFGVAGAGCIVLAISRVCEIVDIFAKVDQARAEGRVASVTMEPAFSVTGTSFEAGVSLRY
jgi:hypothetical protein